MNDKAIAIARTLAADTLHLNNRDAWAAIMAARSGIPSRVVWETRKQLQTEQRQQRRTGIQLQTPAA